MANRSFRMANDTSRLANDMALEGEDGPSRIYLAILMDTVNMVLIFARHQVITPPN